MQEPKAPRKLKREKYKQMIKRKFIIITGIILLPILVFWLGNFHLSEQYFIVRNVNTEKASKIKCRFWKAREGAILGDFLEYNEGYWKIKQGILYVNEKPEAKAVSLVHRCFLNDYILTIQSLDGQKTGSYISK